MRYVYVIAFAAATLLVSCGFDNKEAHMPLKEGWLRIDWPGLDATHVVPIVMTDGTKCIVAGGRYGTAISCDWGKKK